MIAKLARSKQVSEVLEKQSSASPGRRNSVIITNASNSSSNSRFFSNQSKPGSGMKKIAPKNSRADTLESDEKQKK